MSSHGLQSFGLAREEVEQLEAAVTGVIGQTPGFLAVAAPAGEPIDCHADVACHCRVGRQHQVDRVLFGNVGRVDRAYTIELVVLDTQSCAVENSSFTTDTLPEAAALERMRGLAQRVLTPRDALSETAAKSERDVEDVPAVVTVITARQMRDYGITRVEELFRFVPGFEALDTNWGDLVLNLGLPNTILLMIDGVPLYDAMNHFRAFGRDFAMGLDQIDRVEFVRGPGSVMWGANAFLGVVNFITRTPTRETPQLEALARYGTLNTFGGHVSAEQSRRWLSYSVSSSYESSDLARSYVPDSPWATSQVKETTFGNSGLTNNRPSTAFDLLAKVRSGGVQLLVGYLANTRYHEISPTGPLLNADAPGFWQKSRRIYALTVDQPLGQGFEVRAAASRYEYLSWESFGSIPAGAPAVPQGQRSLQGHQTDPRIANQVELRVHHRATWSAVQSQAMAGVAWLGLETPDSLATIAGAYEVPTRDTISFPATAMDNLAAFAQEDVRLFDSLGLSLGARYDYRTFRNQPQSWGVLGTQAALLYSARLVNAKLVYSEGFRPPDAVSLFSTVGTQGNPYLQPERSRALALDATWRASTDLSVRLGGTWTEISNLIVLDPALADAGYWYKPVNRENRVQVLAAFAEVRGRVGSHVEGFGNYTFKSVSTLAADPTAPVPQVAFAPHTASAGLLLLPIEDLRVFLTVVVIGPRPITQLTAEGVQSQVVPTGALINLGFTVNNFMHEKVSLDFKVQNPLGLVHYTPYRVDGTANPLLEARSGREVLVTLRWTP